MDLAGPKNRIKLLDKGKEEGKVKIKEGSLIWLSEKDTGFKKEDIVISLYEKGIIDGLRKGERVMVNKGSHTIKAMETLLDIFKRSGGHHSKKRFTFRSLSIASKFVNQA
jgi:pyruvate kinase